jgi:2',3'-cyclic-nucleotide 2'-phosphodiesterase (5'-nucleotidase family)
VTRRTALARILCAAALSLTAFFPVFAQDSAGVLKLTILHMNDPHAHYAPYEDRDFSAAIGGFAKAQTVMAEIEAKNKAEGRHTLKLLAGDLLTGTPYSMVFKGALGVKLLNKMKFDAATVGNHEFDYGQENLLQNLKPIMEHPLLGANIKTTDGKSLFDSILEKKYSESSAKVVIFGLTTRETPITTHPKNVQGLVFEDPVSTAKGILKNVSDQDLVIALTHLGVEEDKKLAEACPRINVIIGGHSHTALQKPIKIGDTIIGQAGAYAKYVGRIDLDVKDGKILKYSGSLILLDDKVKEDPEIAAIIENYRQRMNSSLEQVIGKTEVFLEGSRWAVRSGRDTNLGRLITHTMAASAGTDVAVMNGGGIRDSIKQGDVTLGAVYTALPFSGTLVTMNLKGEDLLAMLRQSAELPEGSGGKLQTYGIEYHVGGGKIIIRKIGDKPFDPEKMYSLATNDFLAAGGDGYTVLRDKGKDCYNSGKLISDLLVDFIREKQVITPKTLDEIK